jgi:hypothetical protein
MYEKEEPTHKQLAAILEELKKQTYNAYGEGYARVRYCEVEKFHLLAGECGLGATEVIVFSEPVDSLTVWVATAQASYINVESPCMDTGATTTECIPLPATVGASVTINLKIKKVWARRAGQTNAELVVWGFR